MKTLIIVLLFTQSLCAIPFSQDKRNNRNQPEYTEVINKSHFRNSVGKVVDNHFFDETTHVDKSHPQYFDYMLGKIDGFGRHSCFNNQCIRAHGGRAHNHNHGDGLVITDPPIDPPVIDNPIDDPIDETPTRVPDSGSTLTFSLMGIAILIFNRGYRARLLNKS